MPASSLFSAMQLIVVRFVVIVVVVRVPADAVASGKGAKGKGTARGAAAAAEQQQKQPQGSCEGGQHLIVICAQKRIMPESFSIIIYDMQQ